MTKLTLLLTFLALPVLALISEAVIPRASFFPKQAAFHAILSPQTVLHGQEIITTDRKQGNAPLEVRFDAKMNAVSSRDISYEWNFGDGRTAQGKSVSHAFTVAGEYLTTLTITDHRDFSSSHSTTILITEGS